MKIWVDSDVVLDKENTTILYRRTKDNIIGYSYYTPKIGPYVSDEEKVGEIHYDAFKSLRGPGGTYEDVAPGN